MYLCRLACCGSGGRGAAGKVDGLDLVLDDIAVGNMLLQGRAIDESRHGDEELDWLSEFLVDVNVEVTQAVSDRHGVGLVRQSEKERGGRALRAQPTKR